MSQRTLFTAVFLALGTVILASCEILQPPVPPFGMEEAIAVVKQDVLPDAVPEGATYICLRLDAPLPPGSLIEEDAPEAGTGAQSLLASKGLVLDEESYLFFLDLSPGTFYEHSVKYIVVDASGGHRVVDARWWPRVDGQVPEPFTRSTPDPDHVVDSNADLVEPTGVLAAYNFSLSLQAREGFIVVQGLMPHEGLYGCATDTYLNGLAFFDAYKSGLSEVAGLFEDDADEVLETMVWMAEAHLNPITIFIIAHGGLDYVRLAGIEVEAWQFRGVMAMYPDTLFNLLLGSCHSGSFVDNLETLDNVRVVETACATDGGAKPDWDHRFGLVDFNREDTGSEWFSSLLAAAASIVESPDGWAHIQSIASGHGVPLTSALFHVAGAGALGEYASLGLTVDLDLSHRVGATEPQHYRSWVLLVPFRPPG
jgi:hypothetical protein